MKYFLDSVIVILLIIIIIFGWSLSKSFLSHKVPANNSNQKIDYIFFLNVNKDTIIKRIEKRKLLENRTDDDLDTILKRYDTYMETTKPVLDFYTQNPNFYEIDGSLKIEQITAKIEGFLNV